MGRSYYVPRSAKGESRILYIFTIKSFVTTLIAGGVGALVAFSMNAIHEISIFAIVGLIVPFAAIGFGLGALTIPDTPILGPLQKAGGENALDIVIRLLRFRNKKRIYIYGIDRKIDNSKNTQEKKNENKLK